MKRGLTAVTLVALVVLSVGAVGVSAQESPPPVPAAFYGDAEFIGDGGDVPSGLTIEAVVNGEVVGTIETGQGTYGGSGTYDEKLTAQCVGDCSGATVRFRLQGEVWAQENATWESGDVQQLPLTFPELPEPTPTETEPAPPPGDGGGGGRAPTTQPPIDTTPPETPPTPRATPSQPQAPEEAQTLTPLPTRTQIQQEVGSPQPPASPPSAAPFEFGGFSLTEIAGVAVAILIAITTLMLIRLKWFG